MTALYVCFFVIVYFFVHAEGQGAEEAEEAEKIPQRSPIRRFLRVNQLKKPLQMRGLYYQLVSITMIKHNLPHWRKDPFPDLPGH